MDIKLETGHGLGGKEDASFGDQTQHRAVLDRKEPKAVTPASCALAQHGQTGQEDG